MFFSELSLMLRALSIAPRAAAAPGPRFLEVEGLVPGFAMRTHYYTTGSTAFDPQN